MRDQEISLVCKNKAQSFHFHKARLLLHRTISAKIHCFGPSSIDVLGTVIRTMDSLTNTHVVTCTDTRAKLRPILTEDYFSCRPAPYSNRRPALRRGRYPAPLFLSNKEPSLPLPAGPRGWIYTPLSTRSPAFESFRDDHGVRFKQHLSMRDLLLGFKWYLLFDEDALPCRIKYRCRAYLKAIHKCSKEGTVRVERRLRKYWDWLWRKLVFWRPELDELDDDAPYIYWDDVEPGPACDTEDIQSFLRLNI
jgi:hypothetical protein